MSIQQNIKAVLFDLDGTLLDTETLSDKAILKALGNSVPRKIQEARRLDGDRLPWDIKRQIVGKPGDVWVPMVIDYVRQHWCVTMEEDDSSEVSAPIPSADHLWSRWESNFNNYCEEVRECKGATVPMAIATSSRFASVQKKQLRHEPIFRHMKTIVAGDDPAVKNGKPAPDIYLEAARQLGVDPCDCLVFEDATAGCVSGRAAGCKVVAVPDPRMDRSEFDGIADLVLDDLTCFDARAFGLDLK